MALSEFALIARYFARLDPPGAASGVVLGIGDDCAILRPPAGCDLLVSIDTLVSGVHFPVHMLPGDIGHRALAVNLSDLAAMGARPLWYTLALTLPAVDEDWLAAFSAGLGALARRHGIVLVGGDTTRGPLAITIQVHGSVPVGTALRRDGARPGDFVFVSGQPGLAALGLARFDADGADAARATFLAPQPRLQLGERLRGIASAAIDVSDGLLADAGHIAERSGVALALDAASLPLAPDLAALPRADALRFCLAGGDDYELCFTAPPAQLTAIAAIARELALPLTCIGRVAAGSGIRCDGVDLGRSGYQHFPP